MQEEYSFIHNLFLQSFALVMKCFCSRKLDISKRVCFFFTNCDEMLNFLNSKNGALVFFDAFWLQC